VVKFRDVIQVSFGRKS